MLGMLPVKAVEHQCGAAWRKLRIDPAFRLRLVEDPGHGRQVDEVDALPSGSLPGVAVAEHDCFHLLARLNQLQQGRRVSQPAAQAEVMVVQQDGRLVGRASSALPSQASWALPSDPGHQRPLLMP